MTRKHVKINPTTRNKLRNEYQRDRQREKKLKLLIGTTILLLVYGVFLKESLAEDVSTKDNFNATTNKTSVVLSANEHNSTDLEDSIGRNAPSSFNLSDFDKYLIKKNDTEVEITGDDLLPFRPERIGDGTEHEQAGVKHFSSVVYTPYVPQVNYTNPGPKSTYGMGPIFKMSNSILNVMVPDDTFPEGYVEIRDDKNFYMGRRVYNNDWLPLLNRYWLVWLVVAFFLLIIIVIPFVAVCYCCFCCHKRCGRHCPPCDEKPDKRRRCCYGFLLFLLIIGLLFGIIIAFATNRLLETGFASSTRNIGRSSDDACRFLTNTNNHIKHLYINNYQELLTQLTETLTNDHDHIVLDITDVSGSNILTKLRKILENMPKALKLMKKLDKLEKDARFYASQLRDALRGVKRDMNYLRTEDCVTPLCYKKFNITYDMDLGCLHYDNVPNTTIYVEAIKDIIKQDLVQIAYKAQKNLDKVSAFVEKLHSLIAPYFIEILNKGSPVMFQQAQLTTSLVDKVVSDIHLKTMRSSHSFDDIYSKLGVYRNLTNVILCTVLLVILICLIIGLCFGCFTKSRRGYRDDCCNRGTGATWLLIAMLLIFLTLSIIALIGLFYFVFGLLAYHGACAPLRDTTRNNIFNSFDSIIDFHKLPLPAKTGYIGEDNTENPLPPIRLSTALNACRSNESIIDVLQMNKFYSIRNLELLKILKKISDKATDIPKLSNPFTEFKLISMEDMSRLQNMSRGNLSDYHSRLYKKEMCKQISKNKLYDIKEALNLFMKTEHLSNIRPYNNTLQQLTTFLSDLHQTLKDKVNEIHIIVTQTDELLLQNDLNFNESMLTILKKIENAEIFIQNRSANFINRMYTILTEFVVNEVETYKNYVIDETKYKVGRCNPLAYIYENGVDIVCNRMVDPMNGFWVGVLLCCLLFLPILWVAHKLQCLYKKVGLYATPVATGGCPECTGAPGPIKPATVMVCSGGRGNKQCPCPSLRQKSGDCSCSSQANKVPRSPRGKRGRNNENSETISEWGNFFDVEAQQIIVFHDSSHAFPKRKID